MGGRPPSGLEYHVKQLEGSDGAKERLRVILETLFERCQVIEACERLGIKERRFHDLRAEAMQRFVECLEPRPAGRPPQAEAATPEHLRALEERVAELELELRLAQTREEIALVMPHLAQPADDGEKKTPQSSWPLPAKG